MTDDLRKFEEYLAAKAALCDWCRHPPTNHCYCDCHKEGTMSDAREAVAQALRNFGMLNPDAAAAADSILAALKPVIAAEIRAWADAADEPSFPPEACGVIMDLDADADTIASRICGGDR